MRGGVPEKGSKQQRGVLESCRGRGKTGALHKKGNLVVFDLQINCKGREECLQKIEDAIRRINPQGDLKGFLVVRKESGESFIAKVNFTSNSEELDI
jgi:hypothetical protein